MNLAKLKKQQNEIIHTSKKSSKSFFQKSRKGDEMGGVFLFTFKNFILILFNAPYLF